MLRRFMGPPGPPTKCASVPPGHEDDHSPPSKAEGMQVVTQIPVRYVLRRGSELGMTQVYGWHCLYEGWNFNSGNYLFTTDTK